MVDNSKENQFIRLNKDIDLDINAGDFSNAALKCEKAMALAKDIAMHSSDYNKVNLMKTNFDKLKAKLDFCNERLGIAPKKTVSNTTQNRSANVSKAASGVRPQAAKPGKQGEQKEAEPGNILDEIEAKGYTFKFGEIDVKQFLAVESNEEVTFQDVKGMVEEKKLVENEFFLTEEQKRFRDALGIKSKNFILLYGVPGTGKTYFAKAISTELKKRGDEDEETYFFSVVCTQLKDSKVGASEKNIQAVFEFCKQFKHCVLFLDEFEAVAPDRKQSNGDPTAATCVTTLLQMMDGFGSSKGTLVIGATNCPYNLDGAVISRANLKIEIPLPDKELIHATLMAKINSLVASDVNIDALSDKLIGYSNRDIKNLIAAWKDIAFNKYMLLSQKGDTVTLDDVKLDREMIISGMKTVKASTKPSDIERINQFKQQGE